MQKNKKTILSIILIVVVLGFVFFLTRKDTFSGTQIFSEYMRYEKQTISFLDQTMKVYIADNPRTRTRGLSNKTYLPEGKGMLFVFEKPDKYSFWMKDMNFAIDMIWIDEKGKVVYIEKNATPESYPTSFMTNKDALYVLEVNAGFVTQKGIKVGTVFDLGF